MKTISQAKEHVCALGCAPERRDNVDVESENERTVLWRSACYSGGRVEVVGQS
jgi:hypothetical protein